MDRSSCARPGFLALFVEYEDGFFVEADAAFDFEAVDEGAEVGLALESLSTAPRGADASEGHTLNVDVRPLAPAGRACEGRTLASDWFSALQSFGEEYGECVKRRVLVYGGLDTQERRGVLVTYPKAIASTLDRLEKPRVIARSSRSSRVTHRG